MAGSARMRILAMSFAIVAVIAACSPSPGPSPTQTVCNGVSSKMGGCTAERHTFVRSTCQDLAREWAGVLDPALVAILDGPDAVADQSRSVLLKQALVITSVDMQVRLTELGLLESCDSPEFIAAPNPYSPTGSDPGSVGRCTTTTRRPPTRSGSPMSAERYA